MYVKELMHKSWQILLTQYDITMITAVQYPLVY